MRPFHPYADIFPLIEGADFDALVADIKAHGLVDAIWLLDGAILDGRNRSRACAAAGIDVPGHLINYFKPEVHGDPLAFVISKNLKRRHLDESQRAFVAAKLANIGHGGDRSSEQAANLPLETAESKPAAVTQADAARLLNVSPRSVRSAKVVQETGTPEIQRAVEQGILSVSSGEQASKLEPETQREIAKEAEAGHGNAVRTTIKKKARAAKENKLAEKQRALPTEKFGVIYADPEWRFEVYSRDSGMDRAADNHYPTSNTLDIITRPVADIAAADAVLFLWATAPMLPHAFKVMSAWGFTYKSHCIWNKDRIGTGYWFRNKHELLLVGTRGNIPAPAMGDQAHSVIDAPVGKHSAKPEAFLEMIEGYFPNLPKIELNRRGPARPGWSAWGNEAQPEEFDPETGEVTDAVSSVHVDGRSGGSDGNAHGPDLRGVDDVLPEPGDSGADRVADEISAASAFEELEVTLGDKVVLAAVEDDGLGIPQFLRRTA